MAPGGEMFRIFERFGENGLRHGRHECLPYCRNITCSEIYKHQFIFPARQSKRPGELGSSGAGKTIVYHWVSLAWA